MTSDLKIDVVITTFNRKHCVAEAVRSALSICPHKVILIDDASTDDTWDFLTSEFAANERVQLIQNEQNLGVTGSKNRGFEESQADWVLFLDSDDELLSEQAIKLTEILKAAQNKPIVFFRCIDQDGQFVGLRQGEDISIDLATYIEKTSFGEALTAINRSVVKNPPYDMDLRGYEGIGCARLIAEHGPALLSKEVMRIYKTNGNDRLSSQHIFNKRSKLLAIGHHRFYTEFSYAMTIVQRAKMISKIIKYYILSKIFSSA